MARHLALLLVFCARRVTAQPPQPDYAAEMKTATEALAAKDFAGAARHPRSALAAVTVETGDLAEVQAKWRK